MLHQAALLTNVLPPLSDDLLPYLSLTLSESSNIALTTQAVFHRQETTDATLKYLAFNRPSGLTKAEAATLLGRRCDRALRTLVNQNDLAAGEVGDTTIYVHTWEHQRQQQLTERETDMDTDLSPPAEPADGQYLYRRLAPSAIASDNSANVQLAVDRDLLVTVVQIEESGFSAELQPLIHDIVEILQTLEQYEKLKWGPLITRSDTELEYTEAILILEEYWSN